MQVSEIAYANSQYPSLLREISSPPTKLFYFGSLPASDAIMVAIVGTRKPDSYGRTVTHQLAYELARAGIIIVSGLAYGLDAVAHRAALEAGGITIAILGNGLPTIQPNENLQLARDIVKAGGAIMTEQPAGTPGLPHRIIARNRIVAGMAHATVVTQATTKSGTLHTANFAQQYHRLIFAVPGRITEDRSAGPNNLIRQDFAGAVTSASDILDALPERPHRTPPSPLVKATGSATEAKLMKLLSTRTMTSQELIQASGLNAVEFANSMSLLEITGKVRNLGSGQWIAR